MKKLLLALVYYTFRLTLALRYRIKVEGLENLNKDTLTKSGGVLFLPNHPSIVVDPISVSLALWKKFPTRPMITDYMYYTPGINQIARLLNGLPVPNFHLSSNSLKRKRNEDVFKEVIHGLNDKKENFLVYPAGKTKDTAIETLAGSSGVHKIVTEAPNANVVLVRIKGLWGSSFSRAFTNGVVPPVFPTLLAGIKHIFKNLIFFTPKREIIISFEAAPADFPYKSTRLEFNKYLENWYNKPDGLTKQEGAHPGDSLVLVPYSAWSKKLPVVPDYIEPPVDFIPLDQIPEDIQNAVKVKLAEMAETKPEKVKAEMILSKELGLDSLDMAEIVAFLSEKYDVTNVLVPDLTSVNKVMAYAAGIIKNEEKMEKVYEVSSKWDVKDSKKKVEMGKGKTIPEVFFNNCKKYGSRPALGDDRLGIMTYSKLKISVLVMAEYIKTLPGEYVGILLPSSAGTTMLILAVQLAGKVPLMINWTVGPRHLESVIELSKVEAVLSSWAFLDKIDNVDLDGLADRLIMLEDIKHLIGLKQKLKGFYRSKQSVKTIFRKYNYKNDPESKAVLLFTSGTESMPKGVPLTHNNILLNQKSALNSIDIYSNDVFLAILPPFHSFGFTASSLLGILFGFRTAFYPNPTDAVGLASAFHRWRATLVCGAPTFIKGMLKAAKDEQMETLRLCVTGAEKAPPDLFAMVQKLGHDLIEGYGITECSPFLSVNKAGAPSKGVGHPIDNVEIIIVHPETLTVLDVDTQGLILARGPNVFSGYINPGVTSPFVTVNGKDWYKTGDLGYLDKNGILTISGRMKRFVKIGGEMISLGSVESALLEEAHSKGWDKDVSTDEGPTLAVCAKEDDVEKTKLYLFTRFKLTVDQVNATLKECGFSNLVKVSNVYTLEEIPIMGTGKVNYRALESTYLTN